MTARDYDYVGVWCIVDQLTSRCFYVWADGEHYWIPFSQVDAARSEVNGVGDEGILYVARWLAERKGIVYELEPRAS